MHFGEHFMIDGYGGIEDLLNDKDLVERSLKDLVSQLGMRVLDGPYVVLAPSNNKKDPGGWSGFVIIAESHISVHTFPKRGFVSIDVYTCHNGLDTKKVDEYFSRLFQLNDTETNFVKRGTRYPSQDVN